MRTPRFLAAAAVAALLGWFTVPAADGDARLPTPARWPLAGSVRVLAGFDPPATAWGAGHRGLDLAVHRGEPVLAAAAGRVSFAGQLAGRGVVVVDHGSVRTTYEPVDALAAVGDPVEDGAVLGRVGRGGHCSERCLHWGLKQGDRYLDPALLIGAAD
ncbi:MAG TPA: M23 family metallopeptidase, partial [Microlunatus sp.]|nr:M23 family metallopeptidase [Microlunatus sp.]